MQQPNFYKFIIISIATIVSLILFSPPTSYCGEAQLSMSKIPTAVSFSMPIGGDMRGDLTKLSIEETNICWCWCEDKCFDYPNITFDENTPKNDWYVYTAYNKNKCVNVKKGTCDNYVDWDNDGNPDFHPGEDWNEQSKDKGKPVYAIANGRVIFKGKGFGNTLIIAHRTVNGEYIASMYAHMQWNSIPWEAGDLVMQGQEIGKVGCSGMDKCGPHLHFEIRNQNMLEINDVDNDGANDTITLDESARHWPDREGFIADNYYNPSKRIQSYTYLPICADFNGDGEDTFSRYHNTIFKIDELSREVLFGKLGDIPITGDWNGDGDDDIGVFRLSSAADGEVEATFYLDLSLDEATNQEISLSCSSEAVPLIGDWNGNGYDDIGIYLPTQKTFSLYTLNDSYDPSHFQDVEFGNYGDFPIVGDWDGDGDHDIGIFRTDKDNNQNEFYLDKNLSGGAAELGPYTYGSVGDVPIIGDWDGDKDDNIGIYEPKSVNASDGYHCYENIPSSETNNIAASLIIDSSGSMSWNDPMNLRKAAAKIFVHNAADEDQVAIIDFDSYVSVLSLLQTLTENRDDIISNIDLIDSSGGTNLGAGLEEGYHQLQSADKSYKKAAIFMTDGQGSYSNQAEKYLNDENDPQDDWPIYTIGLGSGTDTDLLQNIADTTGGLYFPLSDPDQLEEVYLEIANIIKEGSRQLDKTVKIIFVGETVRTHVDVPTHQESVTFLVTWPGSEVNTTLITPDGREITPTTKDIYHAKGLTYELYRISDPEPGKWSIELFGVDLAPEGENVSINVSSTGPSEPRDTTPPDITISNPVDGKTYFNQHPYAVSWLIDDPESEITDKTAFLNGDRISNNDEILFSKLGENVLTVSATNEVGLTKEETITFQVNSFSWLPPIKYEKRSNTNTRTYTAKLNSTLPIKFAIFDQYDEFVSDPSCKVVVEGTTAEFTVGEGDTNIRINEEEGEDPCYIVNLHTNFKKWDYGLAAGNEYFINVYFDNILAAKTLLRLKN